MSNLNLETNGVDKSKDRSDQEKYSKEELPIFYLSMKLEE